jgi:phosphoenolpyruvate synthase/pyruvate phosphate dikinase
MTRARCAGRANEHEAILMPNSHRYIRFFEDIGIEDVPRVGGKNASLGEMFRELSAQGVRVPNGFAITVDAYWYMLEHASALPALKEALAGLDPANVGDLAARAHKMRDIVYGAGLPEDLRTEILAAYRSLQAESGAQLSLAVRSSATGAIARNTRAGPAGHRRGAGFRHRPCPARRAASRSCNVS